MVRDGPPVCFSGRSRNGRRSRGSIGPPAPELRLAGAPGGGPPLRRLLPLRFRAAGFRPLGLAPHRLRPPWLGPTWLRARAIRLPARIGRGRAFGCGLLGARGRAHPVLGMSPSEGKRQETSREQQ